MRGPAFHESRSLAGVTRRRQARSPGSPSRRRARRHGMIARPTSARCDGDPPRPAGVEVDGLAERDQQRRSDRRRGCRAPAADGIERVCAACQPPGTVVGGQRRWSAVAAPGAGVARRCRRARPQLEHVAEWCEQQVIGEQLELTQRRGDDDDAATPFGRPGQHVAVEIDHRLAVRQHDQAATAQHDAFGDDALPTENGWVGWALSGGSEVESGGVQRARANRQ